MQLAYWCILIAGVMPVCTVAFSKAGARDYDNAEPRAWLERQNGQRRRADYAHRNHFEAFPFFAAAVLVAEQLQANPQWINILSAIFILARVVYTALYLNNKPTPRSLAWFVGYACVLGLFGLAAFAAHAT